jgi:hypothetical protein
MDNSEKELEEKLRAMQWQYADMSTEYLDEAQVKSLAEFITADRAAQRTLISAQLCKVTGLGANASVDEHMDYFTGVFNQAIEWRDQLAALNVVNKTQQVLSLRTAADTAVEIRANDDCLFLF